LVDLGGFVEFRSFLVQAAVAMRPCLLTAAQTCRKKAECE
jgi:hypothetical protein